MSEVLTSLQWQVLGYLRDNVHAAETAAGVNNIWLRRPATAHAIAEVEQALIDLVRRGWMEQHALPGGTALYRKNRLR
jgi:hypothetical protein